jgi:hypothetical protein
MRAAASAMASMLALPSPFSAVAAVGTISNKIIYIYISKHTNFQIIDKSS